MFVKFGCSLLSLVRFFFLLRFLTDVVKPGGTQISSNSNSMFFTIACEILEGKHGLGRQVEITFSRQQPNGKNQDEAATPTR